ncbi:hypothetical protein [Paenibacillus caseinilyticus]|nr:hypothetical protein [Paenibacillus caseinilyticus]MCZ8521189.1 hypothetical protein [Paenibacillus caseinilyticus]
MHLIIADGLAEEFGLASSGALLLGSLAPDAAKPDAARSEAAHFAGRRYIAYGAFLQQYAHRMPDLYLLGYLSHLVGDDIWSIFVHAGGVRARIMEQPALAKAYYRDFLLCNAKLLDAYPGRRRLYDTLAAAEFPQHGVQEQADGAALQELKRRALQDFDYPAAHLAEELQLLSLEDVRHGMDLCIQRSLDLCRSWFGSAAAG